MSYTRDSSEDLIYNSDTGQYEPVATTVVLTIVPTPNDAIVTFSTGTVSGNTCTVEAGTSVTYNVSKTHYDTISVTVTVDADISIPVSLSETLYVYTVVPTPNDATVTLTATGYTQVNNTISVPYNTSVSWSVSKNHYITQSDTAIVVQDYTNNVDLVPENHTLTITPTPNDATVVLTAAGYSQVNNSITVPYGTSVSYTVSKDHYDTRSATVTVNSDLNISVSLNITTHTFTVNPTPNDATVTLIAQDYTQVGNSIEVDYGTQVTWTVSKTNYVTQTDTFTITYDYDFDITLVPNDYIVTFDVTPADSIIIFHTQGTVSGNSITVPYGTTIIYSVSKTGYQTLANQSHICTQTETVTVPALVKDNYIFTIDPIPVDATVVLNAAGYTQVGNSITVPYETYVDWSVSRTGYTAQSDQEFITQDKTLSVDLSVNDYTLTINTTPADAIITSDVGVVMGHNVTAAYGTTITYSVSRTGYQTLSDQVYTITQDEMIDATPLVKNNYTITINPDPVDATVTFDTGTVSGNSCTVPYYTLVNYTISKSGYYSATYSKVVTETETINAPALIPVTMVGLTINTTPADAIKKIYVGTSQTPIIITDTYVCEEGTVITYKVLKKGYVTVKDVVVMDSSKTINVELDEGYLVKDLNRTLFRGNLNITSVDLSNKPWVDNDMSLAFSTCDKLHTVININDQVTNMLGTFQNCVNLQGDIYLNSTSIQEANGCFDNTSLTKNVYIPYTYANLINTTTYNAFTTAGYDELGTKEGVYLKDSNPHVCILNVTPDPITALVQLTADGYETVTGTGEQSISVSPNTVVTYTVSKLGYDTETDDITVTQRTQSLTVSLIGQLATLKLTVSEVGGSGQITAKTYYSSSLGSFVDGPELMLNKEMQAPVDDTIYWVVRTDDNKFTAAGYNTLSSGQNTTSTSAKENKILTLNYTPTDATIIVTDCTGYEVPPKSTSAGQNIYYMPWWGGGGGQGLNTTVSITGSAPGYQTRTITATRSGYNADTTATLNLIEE